MRTAGGTINKHVIYGILMGLIKADMTRHGGYLDFTGTKDWLQPLYSRMNMSRQYDNNIKTHSNILIAGRS